MTPVFQELARRVDLTVAYFAELEADRRWHTEETGFARVILPGRELRVPLALDTVSVHVNPGFGRFLREQDWDVVAQDFGVLADKLGA